MAEDVSMDRRQRRTFKPEYKAEVVPLDRLVGRSGILRASAVAPGMACMLSALSVRPKGVVCAAAAREKVRLQSINAMRFSAAFSSGSRRARQ